MKLGRPDQADQFQRGRQSDPAGDKEELAMLTKNLIFAPLFVLMLAAGAAQAGGDVARGEQLSVDCADCHGADGMGDDLTPKIAGLDEVYHIEQLQAYKSGARTDEDELMLMYTEELSDQDMADLAAYYATLSAE